MNSKENSPEAGAAAGGGTGAGAQKYRRRMRNYLLDVGLQLRYTMTIVIVAVFLTGGLGYKMYQATRDISIGAVGILITHKVAGPLFKISSFFARIRDNRIGPLPAGLRKGDELQEFYASFLDMHQALRQRTEEETRVLGE